LFSTSMTLSAWGCAGPQLQVWATLRSTIERPTGSGPPPRPWPGRPRPLRCW
jgi:hypothetical protein